MTEFANRNFMRADRGGKIDRVHRVLPPHGHPARAGTHRQLGTTKRLAENQFLTLAVRDLRKRFDPRFDRVVRPARYKWNSYAVVFSVEQEPATDFSVAEGCAIEQHPVAVIDGFRRVPVRP